MSRLEIVLTIDLQRPWPLHGSTRRPPGFTSSGIGLACDVSIMTRLPFTPSSLWLTVKPTLEASFTVNRSACILRRNSEAIFCALVAPSKASDHVMNQVSRAAFYSACGGQAYCSVLAIHLFCSSTTLKIIPYVQLGVILPFRVRKRMHSIPIKLSTRSGSRTASERHGTVQRASFVAGCTAVYHAIYFCGVLLCYATSCLLHETPQVLECKAMHAIVLPRENGKNIMSASWCCSWLMDNILPLFLFEFILCWQSYSIYSKIGVGVGVYRIEDDVLHTLVLAFLITSYIRLSSSNILDIAPKGRDLYHFLHRSWRIVCIRCRRWNRRSKRFPFPLSAI